MSKIMPFYEIKEQDLDLIYNSFVETMNILMKRKNSIEELLDLSLRIAWSDFTSLKVLRENLGSEAIDAVVKFRTNPNAFGHVKAFCQKAMEEAQAKPVLFAVDGSTIINP